MASKLATKAKPAPAKPIAAKPPAIAAKKPPGVAAKKAAPKPAPKKPVETVTLKTVFEQLAEAQDLTKKQGQTLLTSFIARVTAILQAGDRVRMTGLGILEVKDRPARTGRNPATGVTVQIAASRKIAFRVSKELKDAV